VGARFHAVAVDYDGTLTNTGRPALAVVAGLDRARARGVRVVLVTGRRLDHLLADFPDVDDHVDAVVAENGAVVVRGADHRVLTVPVDAELAAAIERQGVAIERGEVLLACGAEHAAVVLGAIQSLSLDCQLVHNRGALMVLPPGVSKASGLQTALAELGLSPHDTVGVGDAENDLALLHACELGVAVANAVESLRAHADLLLEHAGGDGVLELLDGPLLTAGPAGGSPRWQLTLGTDAAGDTVTIPASRINVLIAGASGTGKSYVAGLLVEQLVRLGYATLVLDPEGDHAALAQLPEVLGIGGPGLAPDADLVVRVLQHGARGVVVDLSIQDEPARHRFVDALGAAVADARGRSGLPHWVIVDEAHVPLADDGAARRYFRADDPGWCLVTYRPELVDRAILRHVDVVIARAGDSLDAGTAAVLAEVAGVPVGELAGAHAGLGEVLVARRSHPGRVELVTLAARSTAHVRHLRKYVDAALPDDQAFRFRWPDNGDAGLVAGNVADLHDVLATCDAAIVGHHARHRDFSRWADEVLQDRVLAGELARAERSVEAGTATVEQARIALRRAVRVRYLAGNGGRPWSSVA
jgi:hydroxymethylpyrimidine pyrophosphatase-like HAD family hydrolase